MTSTGANQIAAASICSSRRCPNPPLLYDSSPAHCPHLHSAVGFVANTELIGDISHETMRMFCDRDKWYTKVVKQEGFLHALHYKHVSLCLSLKWHADLNSMGI